MADEQEPYEVELRGRLHSVQVPLSQLDTGQIVETARVKARRRRYLTAGGTAAAVLAAAAVLPASLHMWPPTPGGDGVPPGAPPAMAALPPLTALDCGRITTLELPDHADRGKPDLSVIDVQAMDPSGRYVLANWPSGELTGTDDPPAVVLWDGDTATYLPTMRGYAQGRDVNGHGVVVGDAQDETGRYGWIYRDGDVQILATPTGYRSAEAIAINQAGDVVGTAVDANGHPAVVKWPAADPASPEILHGPEGATLTPAAILDDGTVVATLGSPTGDDGGYLWDASGSGRGLPLPAGAANGYVAAAHGHWAVGSAAMPAPADDPAPTPFFDTQGRQVVDMPVRWNLASGTVELLEPAGHGYPGAAVAVTTSGDVVIGSTEPVVVRDGLPYSLPVKTKRTEPRPVAVSEDGTVFAGAAVIPDPGGGDRQRQPTVWRC